MTKYTVDEINERIREAMKTLRSLPDRNRPRDRGVWWPDIPADWLGYGYTDARMMRIMPSARDIDRLDEVMTWMAWLPPKVGKLVAARAFDLPWRPLCERLGKSRTTLHRQWLAAHVLIAERAGRAEPLGVVSKPTQDFVHGPGQVKQTGA